MQTKAGYIDQPLDKTIICTCAVGYGLGYYSYRHGSKRCDSCQLYKAWSGITHQIDALKTKIRNQSIPCSGCTTRITPKRHGRHRNKIKALRLINPYDRGQYIFCCPKCATRSQVTRVKRSITQYQAVYHWWTHLPKLIQEKIDRYFTHSKAHYHKLNKVI